MDATPNQDGVNVIGTWIDCNYSSDTLYIDCTIFIADLQKKLAAVESDNRTIRDEFDVQRAKLKELFLQKEGEYHIRSHFY